jgi:hypothetical protein
VRHEVAAVHELARLGLFANVPGEVLAGLARELERRRLVPGQALADGADAPGRFYVVLAGMLQGPDGLHEAGATFGGPAPIAGTIRAIVPTAVGTCDRDAYERLVAPLL